MEETMHSDLTFITNEEGNTLENCFFVKIYYNELKGF